CFVWDDPFCRQAAAPRRRRQAAERLRAVSALDPPRYVAAAHYHAATCKRAGRLRHPRPERSHGAGKNPRRRISHSLEAVSGSRFSEKLKTGGRVLLRTDN